MTTRTSSLSSAKLAGFSDELQKIAADSQGNRKKKPGKWLKNTLALGAGTAVGYGGAQVADKYLSKKFGPKFRSLKKKTRLQILGTGLGAATMGSYLIADKIRKKRTEE